MALKGSLAVAGCQHWACSVPWGGGDPVCAGGYGVVHGISLPDSGAADQWLLRR
jgi:hypothetical protein